MQFSSELISPGSETQIDLKPEISYTTEDSIARFPPNKRGCYSDGEANLTHLPYGDGFRYEMNNRLIDKVISDVIWNCKCLPSFWEKCWSCDKGNDYQNTIETLDYCTGSRFFVSLLDSKPL